jgi:hypothetical protein
MHTPPLLLLLRCRTRLITLPVTCHFTAHHYRTAHPSPVLHPPRATSSSLPRGRGTGSRNYVITGSADAGDAVVVVVVVPVGGSGGPTKGRADKQHDMTCSLGMTRSLASCRCCGGIIHGRKKAPSRWTQLGLLCVTVTASEEAVHFPSPMIPFPQCPDPMP